MVKCDLIFKRLRRSSQLLDTRFAFFSSFTSQLLQFFSYFFLLVVSFTELSCALCVYAAAHYRLKVEVFLRFFRFFFCSSRRRRFIIEKWVRIARATSDDSVSLQHSWKVKIQSDFDTILELTRASRTRFFFRSTHIYFLLIGRFRYELSLSRVAA